MLSTSLGLLVSPSEERVGTRSHPPALGALTTVNPARLKLSPAPPGSPEAEQKDRPSCLAAQREGARLPDSLTSLRQVSLPL